MLLRLTQLCQKHIPKREKLHDQAMRAGRVDELNNLETNAHAPQLECFACTFCECECVFSVTCVSLYHYV